MQQTVHRKHASMEKRGTKHTMLLFKNQLSTPDVLQTVTHPL